MKPRMNAEEAFQEVAAKAEELIDWSHGGRQTRLETMPYKEYLATPEWGREASSRVPEGGLPVPALQRLGIEFDSVAS